MTAAIIAVSNAIGPRNAFALAWIRNTIGPVAATDASCDSNPNLLAATQNGANRKLIGSRN